MKVTMLPYYTVSGVGLKGGSHSGIADIITVASGVQVWGAGGFPRGMRAKGRSPGEAGAGRASSQCVPREPSVII